MGSLANTTARSMTFSSSRTLPGQSYALQILQRFVLDGGDFLVVLLRAYFRRKCAAKSGISSRRSGVARVNAPR